MKSIMKILMILCLLLFSLSLVSAEGNFTTLQNNILAGQLSSENSYALDDNYTWDNEITTGIVINKTDFVLDGNNFVVDGKNSARLFSVNANNVTFKNIVLINGKAGDGGAISSTGNLNIVNSIFNNNNASNRGGAIYINSNNITITDSTFTNNYATTGGVIYTYTGIVSAINSTFENNSANTGSVISTQSSMVNITNSNFINNTAKSLSNSGGAIASNTGTIIITNSNFLNNIANYRGGAVYGGTSNINVNNSTFINNTATQGGSIYTGSGRLTLNSSTFIDNNATNQGGAIFTRYVDIYNSYFINNTGINEGGAIYIGNTASTGIITGSYFKNNKGVNGSSICILSDNIIMNYNVILDENPVYIKDGTLNINFNWWGTNNVSDKSASNIEFNNYYVMNLTSNQINPLLDEIFNFNYTFFLNGTEDNSNVSNLPLFNVSILINGMENASIDGRFNDDFAFEIINLTNIIEAVSNDVIIVNLTFTSPKVISQIIIDAPTTVIFNDTIEIIVKLLTENNQGISDQLINITIGGIDYSEITDENGSVILNYHANTLGAITINAEFNGSTNYNASLNSTIFTVKELQKNTTIIIDAPLDMLFNETGKIIITLIDSNNQSISGEFINVTIGGTDYSGNTDENGSLIINYIPTQIGIITINSKYDGNDAYIASSNSTTFTVNYIPKLNISVEDTPALNNPIIYVNLVGINNTGLNGVIYFTVNNITRNMTITNGKGNMSINPLPVGFYIVNASYNGYEFYLPVTATTDFNVNKTNIDVIIPKELIINENGTIELYINENATGNITLTVNGTTFTSEIINGSVSFSGIDLKPGNHNAIINYSGDSNFNGFTKTFDIDVKWNTILTAKDIVMFFRNGTQYRVTLTDIKGNPMANITISIVLNGITYNRTTNVNGTAILSLNLIPGNYTIESSFKGNDNYLGSNITTNLTIKTILETNGDFTKHYLNDSQYHVKVLDNQGNPLVGVNVTFNINGIFYNRLTNASGISTLSINLFPGEYIITGSFNGLSYSNTVKVLPTLITNDLTKTFGGPETFDMLVLDGIGKPLKGAKVVVNIHGVFYERTSDDNGIAKLNINLNPGSYIATATWNGYSTSSNVTVLG